MIPTMGRRTPSWLPFRPLRMLGDGGTLLAPLAMTKRDAGTMVFSLRVALCDTAHILGTRRCDAFRWPPDNSFVQGGRGRSNHERPPQLSRAGCLTLTAR